MRIRWKLLLVLSGITMVPLLLLSFASRNAGHELLEEMTERSREVLIRRAEGDLLRRLEAHATLVGKEHQIVNLILKTQSGRLRQILEGDTKETRARSRMPTGQKHFRVNPDGTRTPVTVDYTRIRIDLTRDATVDMAEAERIMQPMLRSFQKAENSDQELILWQMVKLTNGIMATYPYYEPLAPEGTHAHWMDPATHMGRGPKGPSGSMPMAGSMPMPDMEGKEPPPHMWYETARRAPRQITWSSPYRDPITGQFVVSAVSRIQSFDSPFRGAILLMVPLGSVMQADLDATGLTNDVTSLLVHREAHPKGGPGLRIVAEESRGVSTSTDHGGWMSGREENFVETGDPNRDTEVLQEMAAGRSGFFTAPYKGDDSLWVYAPINLTNAGLMLVVPMRNVFGTTVETERFLRDRIADQFLTVNYVIWGMIGLVVMLSLLLSRTMTRRLDTLSAAFHQLAQGDFSIRVQVSGKDELSELAATFNKLAPALEDQVRLKEALTVAQEVQRSLLPEHPPSVDGFDVAGASLYCEDTGGDYFDYPHLGIEADELGLAVGDVSGHGIPAALLMTTARAFLRQRASKGGRLDEVVADANRLLADDVRLSGRFMTLFLFAVDPATLTARWVRAGHDPAMVYSTRDHQFRELGGDTGLPLGVDGDWSYTEETTPLAPGDIILIGTDGIWEAANPGGEMFGKDRLMEIISSSSAQPAQDILDAILEGLRNFTAEAGFEDDVTLAVIKVGEAQ